MLPEDDDQSLSDEATFAGAKPARPRDDLSLGDERTLGGGDSAAGLDTIDGIEIVDLEARYKIEGTLGQGGMGAVLLATDTRLGRKVAIKRILGEAARSKTAIMRFLTEAKAIAALNHPNIVQIYDYGRAKDGPFLIMEFVDGGSLADRCKQGAIPLEEAVELACQICDGLAKAHDAGIVHRDIKPANVLVNKDGLPKLTDFGLAKAEAADHGMTMTGAVMGTPDFMPPEQRRDAAEVDHRSDLWSLAASVYQMVTGRSPKIIRFNDVPVALQDVLAKALEDRKDARYQSAREFRDALKASVRAAAVAVEELVEGACPSCGVKNDSSRRFCRGCGESLEAPCLSCTKPMPMWEEICGSCGAKQTPLVDERRQAMAAKQAEAEGLLGDFEFDRATAIATLLHDEASPKLKHLTGWATTFLEQIEKSRAEQTRHAIEAISEAGKHEAAHDYLSAAFALETIPETMRTAVLPGMREPADRMLERIKKTQAEVRRLETLVKERVAAKQLDELLPDIEKLIALRPDRQDIKKLRAQLLERQQKQAGARDKAIEAAKASLTAYDYEGAVASLTSVPAAAVTPEVVKLRDQAEGLVRQVRSLARKIKDAVAAKELDGLIGTVEQYLTLKPGDSDVVGLLQSLRAREKKITEEIASRLEQARKLEQACQFDEALKLLAAIPNARRWPELDDCLRRSGRLGPMRQATLAGLFKAEPGKLLEAIKASHAYRDALAQAQITDPEFAGLLSRTEAAHAQELRSRRLVFVTAMTAVGVVAAIVLVAAGLWMRSAARAASLASAIAESRWDDALAIEPGNYTALLGLADTHLNCMPPSFDRALQALTSALSASPDAPSRKSTEALVNAVRSRRDWLIETHDRLGRLLQQNNEIAFAQTLAEFSAKEASLALHWLKNLLEQEPNAFASFPPQSLVAFPHAVVLRLPPYVGPEGIRLKLLPPGDFVSSEKEGHTYRGRIAKAFFIGVHEVTNAQYQKITGSPVEPSVLEPYLGGRGNFTRSSIAGNHPVECVSWGEAMSFCEALTEVSRKTGVTGRYRLPTEDEWEYACRSGGEESYCFGSFSEDEARRAGLYGDGGLLGKYCWYKRNASGKTHPVGSLSPNAWGLHDMHGNVREWCLGLAGGDGVSRGTRGGSWEDDATSCDCTGGNWAKPDYHLPTVGFRIVLECD